MSLNCFERDLKQCHIMEFRDFSAVYRQNEPLYYTHQKDACKTSLLEHIQPIALPIKQQLIKLFEKQIFWKEYDYYIYLQLLQGCAELADENIAAFQILNALTINIKEIAIIAMELLKLLHLRIDLEALIKHYFHVHGHNPPDMSYYAYFLATIKSCYGDAGLGIVYRNCTKTHAVLYKLHALKFNQRQTYSHFIDSHNYCVYEDSELIALLFEVICKRREKVLAYDRQEIEFIVNNLPGIDAPAINYFKYFLSHLCVSFNRSQAANPAFEGIHWFKVIQTKCLLLLAEEDTMKIKRGAKIYSDFHDCVIKSRYKTMYTLMKPDTQEERKSPVYLALESTGALQINETDEHLKFIVSLVDETNFHLFIDILERFDCTRVLTRENILCFYNNLKDDYLEDKIDGLLRLLITNWYQNTELRTVLIEETLCGINCWKDSKEKVNFDYDLYRFTKTLGYFIDDLAKAQVISASGSLMRIIDGIIDQGLLKLEKSKIYERILVSALDLLLKLSQKTPLDKLEVRLILTYIEKGVFCNKRYAASASGILYRKFITHQFGAHKEYLIDYVKHLLLEYSCLRKQTSNMRRCLEKRILVHEFCLGVERKHQGEVTNMISDVCIEVMQDCLLETTVIDGTSVRSVIFCMNALMADAALKQTTHAHVGALLSFCLLAVDRFAHDFAICNAIYTLYATLVQRLLPYHDHTKNMTIGSLVALCPRIGKELDLALTASASTTPFSKKSSILLMQLVQRSNNESPVCVEDTSSALYSMHHLEEYFAHSKHENHCCFQTDGVIKLWLNLTPLAIVHDITPKTYTISSQNKHANNLNFLHANYQLLEATARKLNVLNRQKSLQQSLSRKTCENIDNLYSKTRIRLTGNRLQCFGLKNLTIAASLQRIVSKHITVESVYEKITAFEFFFDYFSQKDKLDVFLDKFLMRYVETLYLATKVTKNKLEMFPMCLNTIVYCLDHFSIEKLAENTNIAILYIVYLSLNELVSENLSKTPCLLAFVAILCTKFCTNNIYIDRNELATLTRNVIKGYVDIAHRLDDFQQEEAESLLVAFKYLKYLTIEGYNLKIELFLVAMQFLHSKIFSECDYLLANLLIGLDIDNEGVYLTAFTLQRFMLSKHFLNAHFTCHRSRITAGLRYLHWKHKNVSLKP